MMSRLRGTDTISTTSSRPLHSFCGQQEERIAREDGRKGENEIEER